MPRHSRTDWLLPIHVLVMLVLTLVLLPVILPVVAVLNARERRQRGCGAAVTPCVRCGHILGQAALDAADAFVAEEWRQWRESHPGVRRRCVRRVWAICPRCGMEHDWDKRRGFHADAPLGGGDA